MGEAVILHLSDIHRTQEEQVTNDEILHSLIADIDRFDQDEVPVPNVVVISGDLTQAAELAEYEEASTFVQKLIGRLGLGVDSLVIVPGNHDVHWPTCRENFRLLPQPPAGIPRDLCFEMNGEYLCPTSEDAFEKRLTNFRNFYKHIFGCDYPTHRNNHFTITPLPDLHTTFVGFSSCDSISHKKHRGKINISAIAQAANALDGTQDTAIAVWHHDLNWRGETCEDTLDLDSLRQVSERKYCLGLCGHTHRPAAHDVSRLGGVPMPVVVAGSLCAGPRQRPETVPRAYNVIKVGAESFKVWVRSKKDRSSPWEAQPTRHRDRSWQSWYEINRTEVQLDTRNQSPVLRPQTSRLPTPFADYNAKAAARQDVVRQYVWTDVAYAMDSDIPQIVLGPRGAGKTALMMSLTFEGRLASPRNNTVLKALERVGLLCSMNVSEITAFNGKGWMTEEERTQVFIATIGTIWAQELIHTLEKCLPWARSKSAEIPTEEKVCKLLTEMLSCEQIAPTFVALTRWIKSLRSQLILSIGIRDDVRRHAKLTSLLENPVTRGSPGFLADVAGELARWALFEATRWIMLFDEVEYLNEWQQAAVYDFLREPSQHVVTKLATLPYAHARALRMREQQLFEGNDFKELSLSLTADLELQTGDDSATEKFADLASRLWKNRLAATGLNPVDLSDVWPDALYETVVSTALGRTVTRDFLEELLVNDLSADVRERALRLRASKPKDFRDQYWRKYAQPFRVRFADKDDGGNTQVPLIWGWKAMLRACDGNCRWFLRLADECWTSHWANTGISALKPAEQYYALRRWSSSIYRVLGTMTKEGPILKDIVDKVAADLRARVIGLPHLTPEALLFQIRDFSDEQAEAIAVGVALGYLVPRVEPGNEPVYYPTRNVELRLGFPIAVEKRLPLRSGAVMKIGDLKQVAFQWLRE
jgi:predicted phosphodiesterase